MNVDPSSPFAFPTIATDHKASGSYGASHHGKGTTPGAGPDVINAPPLPGQQAIVHSQRMLLGSSALPHDTGVNSSHPSNSSQASDLMIESSGSSKTHHNTLIRVGPSSSSSASISIQPPSRLINSLAAASAADSSGDFNATNTSSSMSRSGSTSSIVLRALNRPSSTISGRGVGGSHRRSQPKHNQGSARGPSTTTSDYVPFTGSLSGLNAPQTLGSSSSSASKVRRGSTISAVSNTSGTSMGSDLGVVGSPGLRSSRVPVNYVATYDRLTDSPVGNSPSLTAVVDAMRKGNSIGARSLQGPPGGNSVVEGLKASASNASLFQNTPKVYGSSPSVVSITSSTPEDPLVRVPNQPEWMGSTKALSAAAQAAQAAATSIAKSESTKSFGSSFSKSALSGDTNGDFMSTSSNVTALSVDRPEELYSIEGEGDGEDGEDGEEEPESPEILDPAVIVTTVDSGPGLIDRAAGRQVPVIAVGVDDPVPLSIELLLHGAPKGLPDRTSLARAGPPSPRSPRSPNTSSLYTHQRPQHSPLSVDNASSFQASPRGRRASHWALGAPVLPSMPAPGPPPSQSPRNQPSKAPLPSPRPYAKQQPVKKSVGPKSSRPMERKRSLGSSEVRMTSKFVRHSRAVIAALGKEEEARERTQAAWELKAKQKGGVSNHGNDPSALGSLPKNSSTSAQQQLSKTLGLLNPPKKLGSRLAPVREVDGQRVEELWTKLQEDLGQESCKSGSQEALEVGADALSAVVDALAAGSCLVPVLAAVEQIMRSAQSRMSTMVTPPSPAASQTSIGMSESRSMTSFMSSSPSDGGVDRSESGTPTTPRLTVEAPALAVSNLTVAVSIPRSLSASSMKKSPSLGSIRSHVDTISARNEQAGKDRVMLNAVAQLQESLLEERAAAKAFKESIRSNYVPTEKFSALEETLAATVAELEAARAEMEVLTARPARPLPSVQDGLPLKKSPVSRREGAGGTIIRLAAITAARHRARDRGDKLSGWARLRSAVSAHLLGRKLEAWRSGKVVDSFVN